MRGKIRATKKTAIYGVRFTAGEPHTGRGCFTPGEPPTEVGGPPEMDGGQAIAAVSLILYSCMDHHP